MRLVRLFLPHPTHILDMQIVAKRLGYPEGLQGAVKALFGVDVGKEWQRFRWETRPLPYGAKLYARDDARWVQRIFEALKEEIAEDDFHKFNVLWKENVCNTDTFRPTDYGIGHWGVEKLAIAQFLWEKREEWGRELDLNPGLILAKKKGVFKAVVEELYERWVVQGEVTYGFTNPRGAGVATLSGI